MCSAHTRCISACFRGQLRISELLATVIISNEPCGTEEPHDEVQHSSSARAVLIAGHDAVSRT